MTVSPGPMAWSWAALVLVACAPQGEPPASPPRAQPPSAHDPVRSEDPSPALATTVEPAQASHDEPPPPAPPEPVPFEGRSKVSLTELVAALDGVADELAELPSVRTDYAALVAEHALADSDALYRDYVRVRLVFESTRDGGLWGLRWAITNESPNSDEIWKQWARVEPPDADEARPTAFAECDELSALFAFLSLQLGVRHVGLYWPTWNHVVAVWTVPSDDEGKPARVVIPTSQIFLTDDDGLGTRGFDPWRQRTIYEYRRRDVKGSHTLDADLARFFVTQSRRYAGLPQRELQARRNQRDVEVGAWLAERERARRRARSSSDGRDRARP